MASSKPAPPSSLSGQMSPNSGAHAIPVPEEGASTLQKVDFTLETTVCLPKLLSPRSTSSPQKKDMFICIFS